MCLVLTCFFQICIFAQKKILDETEIRQNLKMQAGKMGAAFTASDYKTFENYTYPPLLNSMGGKTKMVEVLNKTVADMKSKGMSFSKITVDEPTKIIQVGKELQSTITQHTEIKLSQGRVVAESTLIAISIDNGLNWKFIDTSNKNIATLRKAMPNLSSAIDIPAPKPPVRYSF